MAGSTSSGISYRDSSVILAEVAIPGFRAYELFVIFRAGTYVRGVRMLNVTWKELPGQFAGTGGYPGEDGVEVEVFVFSFAPTEAKKTKSSELEHGSRHGEK